MLQCDFFGKHLAIIAKAKKATGRACRRLKATCPFQLDLFIKRIPFGRTALKHIRTGTRLKAPETGLSVVFKFVKNGLFIFSFDRHLFSLTATAAALLEI